MRERQSTCPAPLRDMRRLLVVAAHPDDESFGLGALLDYLGGCGVWTAVLCFTHGESSTLHAAPGDLHQIRAAELRQAARVLGIEHVHLLEYPDGGLTRVPVTRLSGDVRHMIGETRPTHLLVFDETGVTGHPDHLAATRAALHAARDLRIPVLAWTLPEQVATALNAQFVTAFAGRRPGDIHIRLRVSRAKQRQAIAAHASQSTDNPVLWQRLTLLEDTEHLRWLYRPPPNRVRQGDQTMSYGFTTRLAQPFSPTVVDRVRAALKEQGFGVLTEIDIRATMRDKLDVDMEDYLILGACNPSLAHRALTADREIGLLLPCNVVVRADGADATLVQALDPQMLVSVTGRPELKAVADDAATRLQAALQALTG